MKKYKSIFYYALAIIALVGSYIYYSETHDYTFIHKEVELDGINFSVDFKYKNKDISGGLQPEIHYESIMEYKVKVDGKSISSDSRLFDNNQPITFDEVYVVKSFENDDFINYKITIEYDDSKDNDLNFHALANYAVLNRTGKGFFYDSWYDDLPIILNENGLKDYTKDDMDTLYKEHGLPWKDTIDK